MLSFLGHGFEGGISGSDGSATLKWERNNEPIPCVVRPSSGARSGHGAKRQVAQCLAARFKSSEAIKKILPLRFGVVRIANVPSITVTGMPEVDLMIDCLMKTLRADSQSSVGLRHGVFAITTGGDQ